MRRRWTVLVLMFVGGVILADGWMDGLLLLLLPPPPPLLLLLLLLLFLN